MSPFLLYYLTIPKPVAYALFFIGMIIEGEFVMLGAAYLASDGWLNPYIVFGLGFIGAILSDLLFYEMGRRIKYLPEKVQLFAEKMTKPLHKTVIKFPERAIFFTKFTYGLHRATLIELGRQGLSPIKFLRADLMAVVMWLFLVGSIGYFVNISLSSLKQYLHYTEIGLLIALVIFYFGIRHFNTYLSKPTNDLPVS